MSRIGIKIMKRSLPMHQYFMADHPFSFALLSKSSGLCYFTGRIRVLNDTSEGSNRDEL